MIKVDLTDAYTNGKYIRGADSFAPKWVIQSKAFREALTDKDRCQLDVPYGEAERAKFDLFLPDAAPEGLFVFVHGGYWQAFDKSSWSHLAAGALARNYAVAVPSYTLAPQARISQMTRQIAAAIDKAASMIAGPIRLAGHSAGGHLVTRMLCKDMQWTTCFAERIKAIVSISGLHDLRPLMATEMNSVLELDEPEAALESAILHDDILAVPTVAWVGADERPVFIEQSRWLARDWPNAQIVLEPARHHFDVIDGLADPESALLAAVMMD